jgi:hypothetical protein
MEVVDFSVTSRLEENELHWKKQEDHFGTSGSDTWSSAPLKRDLTYSSVFQTHIATKIV